MPSALPSGTINRIAALLLCQSRTRKDQDKDCLAMPSDLSRLSCARIAGIAAGIAGRLRPLMLSRQTPPDLLPLRRTPAHPRVATSVALGGVLLAAILAPSGLTESLASKSGAGRIIDTPPMLTAVGSAPAFCKQQTWPNIDARCLKRTEPIQASDVSENRTSVIAPGIKTTADTEASAANQALPKSSSEPTTTVVAMPSGIGSAATSGISNDTAAPAQSTQIPVSGLPPPPGSARSFDGPGQAAASDTLGQLSQFPSVDSEDVRPQRSRRSRHDYGDRFFDRHRRPF
jgi:hypothetical protein